MQIRIRDLGNPGSGMEEVESGIRGKHPWSAALRAVLYIVGNSRLSPKNYRKYRYLSNKMYGIEQIMMFYIFESRINVDFFYRYQPVKFTKWILFCATDSVRPPGWSGWSGDSEGPVIPASPPRPCGHAGLEFFITITFIGALQELIDLF